VTIDKSGANLAGLNEINADREVTIKIRQSKYLNNVVEQTTGCGFHSSANWSQ
jgi:transposase-like protein